MTKESVYLGVQLRIFNQQAIGSKFTVTKNEAKSLTCNFLFSYESTKNLSSEKMSFWNEAEKVKFYKSP